MDGWTGNAEDSDEGDDGDDGDDEDDNARRTTTKMTTTATRR